MFVQLTIVCNVQEQKEVRDAKAIRPMAMLKHDQTIRAASASNKRQSTVQLLTLWRDAATACDSGPSQSTIVDVLDVAVVVVKIEKCVFRYVSAAKSEKSS